MSKNQSPSPAREGEKSPVPDKGKDKSQKSDQVDILATIGKLVEAKIKSALDEFGSRPVRPSGCGDQEPPAKKRRSVCGAGAGGPGEKATDASVAEDEIDPVARFVSGLQQDPVDDDTDEYGDPYQEDANVIEDFRMAFAKREDCGDAVNEELSVLLNELFTEHMGDDQLKALLEKIRRPQNVQIVSPPVNQEIWSNIPTTARSMDLKLQKLANRVAKTGQGLAVLIDWLYKARAMKDDKPDWLHAIWMGLDNFTLCCASLHEICDQRRTALRPSLNLKFKSLCAGQKKEVPSGLFGEDLPQRVKDLNETFKMGATLKPFTPFTFSGRAGSNANSTRGHFLANRGVAQRGRYPRGRARFGSFQRRPGPSQPQGQKK